jgi:predicted metalloendopeptidase
VYTSVRDNVAEQIASVMEKIDLRKENINSLKKLKSTYDICMDETTLNDRGGKPMLDTLKQLNGFPLIDTNWRMSGNVTKMEYIASMIGKLRKNYGIETMISTQVSAYELNSTMSVLQLAGATLQLSLGTFQQHYYINETYANIMDSYKKFVYDTGMLLVSENRDMKFGGVNMDDASAVVEFERQLAYLVADAISNEYRFGVIMGLLVISLCNSAVCRYGRYVD